MCRVRGRGGCLRSNALRREHPATGDSEPENDNLPLHRTWPTTGEKGDILADRYRRLSLFIVAVIILVAVLMAAIKGVRVDPEGTGGYAWLIAALLVVSRRWWGRTGYARFADALGTFGLVALASLSCGAIAMMSLRLGFPMADDLLWSFDQALGFDGVAIVAALVGQGQWVFNLMATAYSYTIPAVGVSIVALALFGDRVEAWRTAFCYIGSLFTICLIAILTPAKGLGLWTPPELAAHLPVGAMRYFWDEFDAFYAGADPVLQIDHIDGVISFPSFHAVMGFIVVAAWRKNILMTALTGSWLLLMLLATFPYGGHYFVDLLAGLAVWAGWFAASRHIERQITRPMTWRWSISTKRRGAATAD